MFESFYGFTRTPFSRDICTENLYQSVILQEAVGRLEYAACRQLFAVLTGDSGTGKTTVIRRFKDILNPNRFMVMYLADSKLTPRHFYKGLLEQLGCEAKFYRGDAKRQLHREIELMKGIHSLLPVVIVDEAHLLDKEMLEEVRFLLNFKMDSESPMALILVGQSELRERLKAPSLFCHPAAHRPYVHDDSSGPRANARVRESAPDLCGGGTRDILGWCA